MQSVLPILMDAFRVSRQTRHRVRKSWEGVDQLMAIEATTVERSAATRTLLGLPVLQNGDTRSSTRSRLLMLRATACIRASDQLALLLRHCLVHLAKRSSGLGDDPASAMVNQIIKARTASLNSTWAHLFHCCPCSPGTARGAGGKHPDWNGMRYAISLIWKSGLLAVHQLIEHEYAYHVGRMNHASLYGHSVRPRQEERQRAGIY
jgi:hypothetical protein